MDFELCMQWVPDDAGGDPGGGRGAKTGLVGDDVGAAPASEPTCLAITEKSRPSISTFCLIAYISSNYEVIIKLILQQATYWYRHSHLKHFDIFVVGWIDRSSSRRNSLSWSWRCIWFYWRYNGLERFYHGFKFLDLLSVRGRGGQSRMWWRGKVSYSTPKQLFGE